MVVAGQHPQQFCLKSVAQSLLAGHLGTSTLIAWLHVSCALPSGAPMSFPCVDCGLLTGNFCDGSPHSVGYNKCYSVNRVPKDFPSEMYSAMSTPLCTYCETRFSYCRFCRGVASCTPPNRKQHWSRIPGSESRDFTEDKAQLAILAEFTIRQQRQDEVVAQMHR